MKKYTCSNYECPECAWGTCQLDNPADEYDEVFVYAEPTKMTVGELMEKLKKYDPTASVEFCAIDDSGFKEFSMVPGYTRLVWDDENKPCVEIY